ncbi:hypothetical protein KSF78_0004302 [Schistosoma japonicum]|nr:hypothetical protein KSF78_0004302 [Schistosoma japonicum]
MVSRVNPKTKVLSSYDIFLKALKTESVFNDKNDFLDIIYWFRQVFAVIIGVVWGLASFTGFLAIVMFFVTNICFVYAYAAMYQRVDEDEYGGYGEIVKEDMDTTECPVYFIKSVEHSPSDTASLSYKATDGSLCFCTVLNFDQGHESGFPLKYCPFDVFHNHAECSSSYLASNSHFRLLLGNSPDMSQYENKPTPQHHSFRSLVEKILYNCTAGDVYNVVFGFTSKCNKHGHPSEFHLSLRVDYVLVPPICSNRTANIHTEMLESDPKENITVEWNPYLSMHWLYRAWYLKERGSWLVNHHSKHLTLHSNKLDNYNDDNKDELLKYIWSSAFICYSRALQLVSLAYWAEKTCFNDDLQSKTDESLSTYTQNENTMNNINWNQLVSVKEPIIIDNDKKLKSSDYIDWDHFGNDDYNSTFSLKYQPIRLMFTLLSNIALCQLKVKSYEYCARNCSYALYLLSRQINPNQYSSINDHYYYYQDFIKSELFSQEKLQFFQDNFEISYHDIHKLLFRRAQSYYNQGKMDEAKFDLENCIDLLNTQLTLQSKENTTKEIDNRSNMDEEINDTCKQIRAALQISENLLVKVNDRISRDQAELISRLKKRTHVN